MRIMPGLTSMRNIGKEMEKKLKTVGINSPGMLTRLGAKQAFLKLKEIYPEVCLVHLYTLYGAIEDIEYNCLPETTKSELKEFSDSFK